MGKWSVDGLRYSMGTTVRVPQYGKLPRKNTLRDPSLSDRCGKEELESAGEKE